jgi:tRNA splicing endonuclease
MTIYQATEIHGEFASIRAPKGMSHDQLVELYAELVERGCLIREGIKFKLSTRAWTV